MWMNIQPSCGRRCCRVSFRPGSLEVNNEVLWSHDSSPAIYRPFSANWCRITMGGTEAASACGTGCQGGKKLCSVMWIYSEQSHWFNFITVTLMEIAGSLHENVTDLTTRNITQMFPCWSLSHKWQWSTNNYYLNLMYLALSWCSVSLCVHQCLFGNAELCTKVSRWPYWKEFIIW